MNTITKQQLYSRWDALSDTLRDAMTSDINSQLVLKTGEAEHLSEEKIAVVSKLVGYVLMGFIHPEDLAVEIKNNLGIDARIASAIAEPINKKVFQPIQESLEEMYAPAGEEPHMPQPVILDEIAKPAPASQIPPVKSFELPPVPAAKTAEPKIIAPPAPAAPKPIPAPATIPAPAAISAAAKPAAGRQLPVNMFSKMPTSTAAKPTQEKVSEEKPAVPVAEKQAPAVMPEEKQAEEPMPFMLHQESESQPISPIKSTFKVGLSQEQFGKMEQKWAAPPRPAQIETSAIESSAQNQRVVHYGDMKTPLPPAPPKSAQGSEGSENPFEILRRNSNSR